MRVVLRCVRIYSFIHPSLPSFKTLPPVSACSLLFLVLVTMTIQGEPCRLGDIFLTLHRTDMKKGKEARSKKKIKDETVFLKKKVVVQSCIYVVCGSLFPPLVFLSSPLLFFLCIRLHPIVRLRPCFILFCLSLFLFLCGVSYFTYFFRASIDRIDNPVGASELFSYSLLFKGVCAVMCIYAQANAFCIYLWFRWAERAACGGDSAVLSQARQGKKKKKKKSPIYSSQFLSLSFFFSAISQTRRDVHVDRTAEPP